MNFPQLYKFFLLLNFPFFASFHLLLLLFLPSFCPETVSKDKCIVLLLLYFFSFVFLIAYNRDLQIISPLIFYCLAEKRKKKKETMQKKKYMANNF